MKLICGKGQYLAGKHILPITRYQGFLSEAPSGYLTKHDINRMYSQFFPFGDSLPFAQLLFNMFDEDRDGRLDFGEFVRAMSVATRGKFMEKLVWSFGLYDIDRDGYLSRDEVFLVTEAIYLMLANISQVGPQYRQIHCASFLHINALVFAHTQYVLQLAAV